MLEVRQLRVRFGSIEAVAGIDFDIYPGEAVALLGPNGAGKSTTLRAATALEPFTGSVRFDGVDCRRSRPDELARQGLIHVPEGRHVFPTLTVQENLQMGLHARGSRASDYELDDVYDLFPPLTRLRRRDGWGLSGGEQQMVAIGRALVAAPRLLLLDEPSLGLAPIVAKSVYRALATVATRTALLIVEQNTTMALGLCRRGYVLNEGRIVLSGTAAQLADRSTLLDSYLGQQRPQTADHLS